MKLERTELVNFRTHAHTVWEPGDARLCILIGRNGAGKTTLVSEALGHALFKDDRGSVNGGVRNGQTDSAVTVEFALDGHRYRATRRRSLKGAGKSSADLQVMNGAGWTPLASGDKEVPAEVRELLHMDAATFRTSVSLAQGDLKRFVDATAAGRKEVLAAIVVDPRFKPAAARALERARDVDARLTAGRDRVSQLDDAIAELLPSEHRLGEVRAKAAIVEAELEQARSSRNIGEARLRELEAKLAAAAATADELRRLEQEIAGLIERYRGIGSRKASAETAIAEAEGILAQGADVDEAIAALPVLRETLEALERAEAEERHVADEARRQRQIVLDIERPWEQANDAWRFRRDAQAERVAEAEAHGKAGSSVCQACGQAIGRETALAQLAAARATLHEIEAEEPKRPIAIDVEQSKLDRLERRLAEAAIDPAELAALRRTVAERQALAARGEALEAARATLERERGYLEQADADLADVQAQGQAKRQRLAELNEAHAGFAAVEAERDAAMLELARIGADVDRLEAGARDLAGQVGRLEENVTRLEQLRAERAAAAAAIAGQERDLERLRYLAGRFGLKGIPARVIESVLPELTRYANEVLAELFGLQLDIRATRASADGRSTIEALDLVVCKDGAGEVELEGASGGQGTAIALALALGLSRLNARRAGTPIRTWVVDEPEGLDTARLKALGAYLRDLVHRGELERVVVITHTTELAEFGDRVDEVREGPAGAELVQVA